MSCWTVPEDTAMRKRDSQDSCLCLNIELPRPTFQCEQRVVLFFGQVLHSSSDGDDQEARQYFRGHARNLEFENFEETFKGLHGKLDALALIIKGIADNNFEPKHDNKVFSNGEQPMAAPSTNKWVMLLVAGWSITLEQVIRNKWSIDQLHQADMKWLCKIGCFCRGIDPGSALVSLRLCVNADFINMRSNSVFGKRWLGITHEVGVRPSVEN